MSKKTSQKFIGERPLAGSAPFTDYCVVKRSKGMINKETVDRPPDIGNEVQNFD